MNRITVYFWGLLWMIFGVLMLAFVGAAEWGAPLIPSYIGAAVSGLISFASAMMLDMFSRRQR